VLGFSVSRRCGLYLGVGVFVVGVGAADPIYRSVDEAGHVTFSTLPPAKAARVEALPVEAPPPSSSAANAAASMEQIMSEGQRLEAQRAALARARAIRLERAEQALAQAYAELNYARNNYDWQGKAGGGRRLSEAYFARIAAAEAQVRAAQEALDAAR